MKNQLFFNEILPIEELIPAEMNAIVGGIKKSVGCSGKKCSCESTVLTNSIK